MLARRNLPFEKSLRAIKINRMAEGAITPRGNQVIETNINMVNSKVRFNIIAEGNFKHGSSATQGKYLFRKSKGGSFHQQLKTGTIGINDFDTSSSKKIIYRRNTKCTTGRKAITVCKTVGTNYTRPINFVNS